jgi:hypothetical protein
LDKTRALPLPNIGTLHGGHRSATWVDLNVKNPKAPVVTREVEDGLGAGQTVNHRRGDNYCPAWRLSYPPAMLRVTIYATLKQGGQKFLAHQTRKEKRTEPLIAPTNRQLKSFRKQKKRNLIRGSMSGQLRQRRPSTSNNGYEELDACFVVRDHNGRALLLIGERERPRQPRAAPQAAVCLCSGHG